MYNTPHLLWRSLHLRRNWYFAWKPKKTDNTLDGGDKRKSVCHFYHHSSLMIYSLHVCWSPDKIFHGQRFLSIPNDMNSRKLWRESIVFLINRSRKNDPQKERLHRWNSFSSGRIFMDSNFSPSHFAFTTRISLSDWTKCRW